MLLAKLTLTFYSDNNYIHLFIYFSLYFFILAIYAETECDVVDDVSLYIFSSRFNTNFNRL